MSDLNLNQNPNADQPQNQEDLEIGLKVLSFCIPIAGAIIYFVNTCKSEICMYYGIDRFWCRTCSTNHPKNIRELGKQLLKCI